MPSMYDVSQSRFVPVPADAAMDAFLPIPLEQLFTQRVGPIPAITEVRWPTEPSRGVASDRGRPSNTDQRGSWTEPGQTRRIHLADGGQMTEKLTMVDSPHSFGYELQDIHGPMRPLVVAVQGRWSFDAEGAGTRITWSWRIRPTNAATALLMPVFGYFWRGYAARALEQADRLLQG